jgi:methylenetetrahydrofolate reductase (NADPH)
VFPGTEVLQPTVVDPATFTVWKDEAFGLWSSMWASLYPEGSPSRALVEGMRERLVLVNLVDNDYRAGDLWAVLDAFVSSGAASTRA